MKTDVDTCLKEIADFYVKNRRSMTEFELEAILKKHCESAAEAQKFVSFLETEPGQVRFLTLLRERKVSPAVIPTEPSGKCYEDAWRFIKKEEEGELIHGSIESQGKRIGHAWVETETGYIWEPEHNIFFTKPEFAKFKPIEDVRYSVDDAMIMAVRAKNLGPWTEQERKQN